MAESARKFALPGAEPPDTDGPPPPRRSWAASILFPLASIAVATAGLAGGVLVAVGPDGLQQLWEETAPENESATAVPLAPQSPLVALPDTVFELDAPGGPRYLMAAMSLELSQADVQPDEQRVATLMAAIQTYVRALTPQELQGAGGLYRLRTGVLHRAQRILGAEMVKDVLISEMLVG